MFEESLMLGIKKMMMTGMILIILVYTAVEGILSRGMLGSWGQTLL